MNIIYQNSINIPVYNIEKDINTITNDINSVIILYCQMGSRSRKALEKLERLGYKNLYNLKGGLENL